MSYNIKLFLHKTCYGNRNYHIFDINESFENVVSWCLDNNCNGFMKTPEGYYIAKDIDITTENFINSLNCSMVRSNNYFFYVLETR